MRREDIEDMRNLEDIIEKDLRAKVKKVIDANNLAPGDAQILKDSVCLMKDVRELMAMEEDGNVMSQMRAYAPNRNPRTGQFTDYGRGYSGHSTKDRMIASLEDVMGEVHNEYEAQMVADVIRHIQTMI